jgi:hypothetical protein
VESHFLHFQGSNLRSFGFWKWRQKAQQKYYLSVETSSPQEDLNFYWTGLWDTLILQYSQLSYFYAWGISFHRFAWLCIYFISKTLWSILNTFRMEIIKIFKVDHLDVLNTLCRPKFLFRYHKIPTPSHILSQINPVHVFPSYFLRYILISCSYLRLSLPRTLSRCMVPEICNSHSIENSKNYATLRIAKLDTLRCH